MPLNALNNAIFYLNMGGVNPLNVLPPWFVTLMQLAADFYGGSDFSHKFNWGKKVKRRCLK